MSFKKVCVCVMHFQNQNKEHGFLKRTFLNLCSCMRMQILHMQQCCIRYSLKSDRFLENFKENASYRNYLHIDKTIKAKI